MVRTKNDNLLFTIKQSAILAPVFSKFYFISFVR